VSPRLSFITILIFSSQNVTLVQAIVHKDRLLFSKIKTYEIMKKNKITQSVNWQKVMRISLVQFIALCLMVSFSYAHTTNAQTVLDMEVTIKVENVSLKQAIQQLQGQTQVKFVYSSRIKLNDKVSLNAEIGCCFRQVAYTISN
jgi:hypothetical protein